MTSCTDAMFALPEPRFMPCAECGASVARAAGEQHRCDEARRLEYELMQHRSGLQAFEDDFTRYLQTPQGRFAAWDAERRRT